jgi:hypothetical protein
VGEGRIVARIGAIMSKEFEGLYCSKMGMIVDERKKRIFRTQALDISTGAQSTSTMDLLEYCLRDVRGRGICSKWP